MIIAVDFDGTCVSHEYPKIGRDIGAVPVLQELFNRGHQLILWTMRDGPELKDAVKWFEKNKIVLFGINKHPTQHKWTETPKCSANLYIDDLNLGCPLKREFINERPFVDWIAVRQQLIQLNIL